MLPAVSRGDENGLTTHNNTWMEDDRHPPASAPFHDGDHNDKDNGDSGLDHGSHPHCHSPSGATAIHRTHLWASPNGDPIEHQSSASCSPSSSSSSSSLSRSPQSEPHDDQFPTHTDSLRFGTESMASADVTLLTSNQKTQRQVMNSLYLSRYSGGSAGASTTKLLSSSPPPALLLHHYPPQQQQQHTMWQPMTQGPCSLVDYERNRNGMDDSPYQLLPQQEQYYGAVSTAIAASTSTAPITTLAIVTGQQQPSPLQQQQQQQPRRSIFGKGISNHLAQQQRHSAILWGMGQPSTITPPPVHSSITTTTTTTTTTLSIPNPTPRNGLLVPYVSTSATNAAATTQPTVTVTNRAAGKTIANSPTKMTNECNQTGEEKKMKPSTKDHGNNHGTDKPKPNHLLVERNRDEKQDDDHANAGLLRLDTAPVLYLIHAPSASNNHDMEAVLTPPGSPISGTKHPWADEDVDHNYYPSSYHNHHDDGGDINPILHDRKNGPNAFEGINHPDVLLPGSYPYQEQSATAYHTVVADHYHNDDDDDDNELRLWAEWKQQHPNDIVAAADDTDDSMDQTRNSNYLETSTQSYYYDYYCRTSPKRTNCCPRWMHRKQPKNNNNNRNNDPINSSTSNPPMPTKQHSSRRLSHRHSGATKKPHETIHAQSLVLGLAFCAVWTPSNLMAPNLTAIANSFGYTTNVERDLYLGSYCALVSGVFSFPLAAGVGFAADFTAHRQRLFCVTVLGGALATVGTAWSQQYWQLLLSRWACGAFMAGSVPVAFSFLSDMFKTEERNAASSGLTACMGLGIVLGQLYAGHAVDWRRSFVVSASFQLMTAVLCWLVVQEPIRGGQEPVLQELLLRGKRYDRTLTWANFWHAMRHNASNGILLWQGFFSNLPWGVIFVFLNDYLSQERGFAVADATFLVVIFGVGCAVGGVLGGYLGQVVQSSNRAHLPLFMSFTTVAGILPFLGLLNAPYAKAHGVTAWSLAFLCGCIASLPSVNVRPCILNVNPPETRGASLTAANLFVQLGRGVGPSCSTTLSTLYGVNRQVSFNVTVSWTSLRGRPSFCRVSILLSPLQSLRCD